MPEMDGIEFCTRIVANRPDIPVVVMTAFGNLETAVAAIRAGAYDFVTKPIEMEFLALSQPRRAAPPPSAANQIAQRGRPADLAVRRDAGRKPGDAEGL